MNNKIQPTSESNAYSESAKEFAGRSKLYQEFLAEREEILRHKWIESEKEGIDIFGFAALFEDASLSSCGMCATFLLPSSFFSSLTTCEHVRNFPSPLNC